VRVAPLNVTGPVKVKDFSPPVVAKVVLAEMITAFPMVRLPPVLARTCAPAKFTVPVPNAPLVGEPAVPTESVDIATKPLPPSIEPRLSTSEDSTGTALSPAYIYDTTTSNAMPKLNHKHQLPPIVDIAVVAISETTANRIQWDSSPPNFGTSDLFKEAIKMDADLETLRTNIDAQGLSARVFRTSVPISAARWSTEQAN